MPMKFAVSQRTINRSKRHTNVISPGYVLVANPLTAIALAIHRHDALSKGSRCCLECGPGYLQDHHLTTLWESDLREEC